MISQLLYVYYFYKISKVFCPSPIEVLGLSWCLSGKESTCQCRRHRFDPWVGEGNGYTPIFLPGKSHGQSSLAGCGPWGQKWVGHNLVTQQEWKTYVLLKTKRTQKYLTKIYYSKIITFILCWFFLTFLSMGRIFVSFCFYFMVVLLLLA